MTEKEFFLKLFPQEFELLNKSEFVGYNSKPLYFYENIDLMDKPRDPNEGSVCECVGENTNKALTLYFQSIITQGIELPIFINSKKQVMDGHHRIQAYNLLGREEIPIYRNKLWRNHGFCWKNGLEGKRKLRLNKW